MLLRLYWFQLKITFPKMATFRSLNASCAVNYHALSNAAAPASATD